jgi:uncharacterized iron-regulated protein
VLNLLLGAILLQQPVAPTPVAAPAPAAGPAYIPERVYDTRRRAFADLESMLADLAKADVVFVGEQHDDPNTHRLEAAILDGLRRRGVRVTLSLEMFERDTQAGLNSYLSGGIAETDFLSSSRPWPRYATDYRPLVEVARTEGWPVIAANVPRRFASSVAKTGLAALDTLGATERSWVAADLRCPQDGYFDRFAASMGGHQAAGSTDDQKKTTERYYFSQCVKDETMAEAIAVGFDQFNRKLVVHVNGAFHSDFGLGTAERVRRRLSGRRVAVVSVLPVKNLDTLAPAGEDLQRADYLLYTVAEPTK